METPAEEREVLMRVIVGSKAHGLARPDSDTDYKEVFVIPTREILSLGRGPLKYAWQSESRHVDDEGGDEVAKWLHLCLKGAPNAVEMIWAPLDPEVERSGMEGDLQRIARLTLSRKPTQEGVIGYAMNSFRKIAERPGKWKAGMLRVLYQGEILIRTGETSLIVPEDGWGEIVRTAAADHMTEGEALDEANSIIERIKNGPSALPERPDFEAVNLWLMELRQNHW